MQGYKPFVILSLHLSQYLYSLVESSVFVPVTELNNLTPQWKEKKISQQ